MNRLAALCGALLLGAGVASAQDVAFDTLARGSNGAPGAARDLVIRSQQELQASGIAGLLPAGAQVDWQNDMLIAVLMGTKNTGGYSVEVTRLERTITTPPPSPGHPPPLGLVHLSVEVARRSPPPGSIVTMAITSPFHIIKTARVSGGTLIDFVDATSGFDAFERRVTSAIRTATVRVERGGRASVVRTQINALIAPIDGTATQAELDALRRAIADARFSDIPATLPTPNPAPAGGSLFTYTLEGASPHAVRGQSGFEGPVRDRLRLIDAALDAIVTRLEQAPAARAFDSVSLDIVRVLPGAASTRISVGQSGNVQVTRRSPNPHATFQPIFDQATSDELDALDRAVRGARLASIPQQLPVPVHIMAADTFSLSVASQTAAFAGQTAGELGYLQQHEARLRPLIDALQAIVDRVTGTTPTPSLVTVKGRVRLVSSAVIVDGKSITGPLRETLRAFEGHEVGVEGQAVGNDVEATRLLQPEERTDAPVQVSGAGGPAIVYVGERLRTTFGPAARVITRLGRGRSLEVDGFVFTSLAGSADELYAASVAGRATGYSVLTQNGQWAGYVRKGQKLEVVQLSSNGQSAFVRAGNRSGWMRTSRLEVGELPVPLHGPSATPGLTGSVPGQ
jgi:hypothetical protein